MMDNFNKVSSSIKNWAVDDRPREKMLVKGAESLSNSELLAILINNGNKEKSAVELAKDVLALGDNNLLELGRLSIKDLQKVKGIGEAKAITIAAALELGMRRQAAQALERNQFFTPRDVADYIIPQLTGLDQEVFGLLCLNNARKFLAFDILHKGSITSTVVDVRLIMQRALELGAVIIIICHNHPSGSLIPSEQDNSLTQRVAEAAKIMDIRLMDHIIVGENDFYSYSADGKLP